MHLTPLHPRSWKALPHRFAQPAVPVNDGQERLGPILPPLKVVGQLTAQLVYAALADPVCLDGMHDKPPLLQTDLV